MKTAVELTETLLGRHHLQQIVYSEKWMDLWDETNNIVAGSLNIVWDPDVPLSGGTMILEPHLTPLDWILAVSIRRLKGDTRAAWIDTSAVNVIDVGANLDRATFSDTVMASLLGQMPWVRVFAPLSLGRAGYQDLLKFENENGNPILNRRLKDALDEWERLGNNQHRLSALQRLNRAWQTWIESSDDHHDLNNLLGAEFFSGNTQSAASRALLHRLQWSGLGGSTSSVEPIGMPETACDVVVVDDQASPGWGSLFERLLGRTGQTNLKAGQDPALFLMTSPKALIRTLKLASLVSASLKCAAPMGAENNPEIVAHYGKRVFDAPHWTTEETNLRFFIAKGREEEEWYRELACAALQVSGCQGLAWGSFDEIERGLLARMADWKALDWLSDEVVALKLSLLPRLCAFRWPSVPIILFSHTRNRQLIDHLANYSNIFIAAPKPNLLGLSADHEIREFGLKFEQELKAADGLLRLQSEILLASRAHSQAQDRFVWEVPDQAAYYQIVIAFDESGDFGSDKNSAVAAIILVARGTTKADAEEHAFLFQERLRAEGVHFNSNAPYYHESKKPGNTLRGCNPRQKQSSIEEAVRAVTEEFARDQKAWLAGFCLTTSIDVGVNPYIYRDNVYLSVVQQAVRLFFCQWLPAVGLDNADNVRISMWFADKQTSFDTRTDAEQEVNYPPLPTRDIEESREHARRLDFRSTLRDGAMTEAIGGHGSAYLTVQSALSGLPASFVKSRFQAISLLRTRKLVYSNIRGQPNHFWNTITRRVVDAYDSSRDSNCIAEYSPIAHLVDRAVNRLVAEEAIFPNPTKFGEWNIVPFASFSVFCDERLSDLQAVATQLSREESYLRSEALKIAKRSQFFACGLGVRHQGLTLRLERRVGLQVLSELSCATGVQFAELSGQRVRHQAAVSQRVSSGSTAGSAVGRCQAAEKFVQSENLDRLARDTKLSQSGGGPGSTRVSGSSAMRVQLLHYHREQGRLTVSKQAYFGNRHGEFPECQEDGVRNVLDEVGLIVNGDIWDIRLTRQNRNLSFLIDIQKQDENFLNLILETNSRWRPT